MIEHRINYTDTPQPGSYKLQNNTYDGEFTNILNSINEQLKLLNQITSETHQLYDLLIKYKATKK